MVGDILALTEADVRKIVKDAIKAERVRISYAIKLGAAGFPYDVRRALESVAQQVETLGARAEAERELASTRGERGPR